MKVTILSLLLLVITPTMLAADISSVIAEYEQQGTTSFSVENGEKLWKQQIRHQQTPFTRGCTSCHGQELTKAGKHVKTGKLIKPMAPSVNSERFKDKVKIEKWFLRNCKWAWGRECSVQEKGDILRYLSHQ